MNIVILNSGYYNDLHHKRHYCKAGQTFTTNRWYAESLIESGHARAVEPATLPGDVPQVIAQSAPETTLLSLVDVVGERAAATLEAAGYFTLTAALDATDKDLLQLKGFGKGSLSKLREYTR